MNHRISVDSNDSNDSSTDELPLGMLHMLPPEIVNEIRECLPDHIWEPSTLAVFDRIWPSFIGDSARMRKRRQWTYEILDTINRVDAMENVTRLDLDLSVGLNDDLQSDDGIRLARLITSHLPNISTMSVYIDPLTASSNAFLLALELPQSAIICLRVNSRNIGDADNTGPRQAVDRFCTPTLTRCLRNIVLRFNQFAEDTLAFWTLATRAALLYSLTVSMPEFLGLAGMTRDLPRFFAHSLRRLSIGTMQEYNPDDELQTNALHSDSTHISTNLRTVFNGVQWRNLESLSIFILNHNVMNASTALLLAMSCPRLQSLHINQFAIMPAALHVLVMHLTLLRTFSMTLAIADGISQGVRVFESIKIARRLRSSAVRHSIQTMTSGNEIHSKVVNVTFILSSSDPILVSKLNTSSMSAFPRAKIHFKTIN
ncbi:hypothetical protein GQ42DRAFT_26057 [Ramicandelaber brevisporus]|nr:hypothetical protein GQ42DRAFT_26057 [Ramicandelaber brevisporus]